MKKSLSVICLAVVLATGSLAQKTPGIDLANLDKTVPPADNFYRFTNGAWIDRATIPADQPGRDSFYEVQEKSQAKLRQIVERLAAAENLKAGSIEKKIADFYRLAADEPLREQQGVKPIEPLLRVVDQVKNREDLFNSAALLGNKGVSVLFEAQVSNDFKDSKKRLFQIAQGGLGLPDRDFYVNDDVTSKFVRTAYERHISKMFALAGFDAPASQSAAKRVMAIETRLAKASRTQLQMRDIASLYHKITFSDLVRSSNVLPWARYFATVGAPDPGLVNLATPEFFKDLDKSVQEIPLDDWKLYLKWHVLSSYGSALTKAFRDENFRFVATFSGQKEQPPAWKRSLESTSAVLGEPLGKLYVAEAFSATAKAKAKKLILGLQAAFRKRIIKNEWMTESTKKEALRKLNAITIKVGYPDKWHSYQKLEVGTDSLVANLVRASEFAHQRLMEDLKKPVDRTEWSMTPQTVNAYYNPLNNEIVFPAAILQSPFFDPLADEASNYGAIGMVIGHEMTHGFDDQGRIFDAKGNLRDWWQKDDEKGFQERKNQLIKQYDKYTAIGTTKVNGALTIGENIADLGGIHIAYDALELALGNRKRESIDGFKPEQRFFIAFGQIWKFKSSPQYAELLARLDVHSPSPVRVTGTLVNVPEFVNAFGKPSVSGVGTLASGNVRIW